LSFLGLFLIAVAVDFLCQEEKGKDLIGGFHLKKQPTQKWRIEKGGNGYDH
jgi:hypothetical protein